MLQESEKKFLLDLARRSIWYFFHKGDLLEFNNLMHLPKLLKTKLASFVTLKKYEELRGCIGHILPIQPLYQDVIENSVAAAFRDPRFPPLHISEFNEIKIAVSVLSKPKILKWFTLDDLFEQLKVNQGVILRSGLRQATYLPEVWQQLPQKEKFLSSLARKAGLPSDIWTNPQITKIYVYETKQCEG